MISESAPSFRAIAGTASALALSLVLATSPVVAQEPPAADVPAGTISIDADARDDAAIRRRIRDILGQVEGLGGVSVKVDAGVVTLTGEVIDSAAMARLERLVARVDGVADVQNEVRETTNLARRLGSVRDRLTDRLLRTLAYLPLLGVALVTALLIGWLGRRLARLDRPWSRIAPNPFIAEILRQAVRLAGWLVAGVVALDILGATALLGTILGAAGIIGIALGFAVRDTVENFIASILLSVRQPFRPNDLVEIEGVTGRVIRLTSRATTLLSLDGNHIRIPNATVFKARITNFTRNPERRFVFDLGVDAEADLAAVRDLGLKTLRELDFVLDKPEPAVWVDEVGDSTVTVRFTGWVTQKGVEFNLARGEAIRVIKETVENAGFGLPEPTYRVRVVRGAAAAPEPAGPPQPAAAQPLSDIMPDQTIDQLVAAGERDGEPNLLSHAAPQE